MMGCPERRKPFLAALIYAVVLILGNENKGLIYMQLVVENIAKSFGIHEIFKNVSFMLDRGEKVGLVGINGGGKTTLLRCLLEPESIDKGSIKFEPGLRIGYVEQGFQGISTGTLWEFLVNAGKEIIELRQKMAALEKQVAFAKGAELESLLADYARVSNVYEHADGYNYENRIKMVLHGLGFSEKEWDKSAEHFSGGQKTRILLAAALVKEPDLLILDEPTNHLDIRMTEWLEGYLSAFKGGVLIVSHDRYFLNNVVDRILEMSGERLQNFKGNYDQYLVQKEIQTATLESAYEAQQEYIARTEAYIRRFKAGIKSKMARGRQSQLNRLERIEGPERAEEFELRLPPAPESAEKVLVLEDLSVGYGENILLKNIDLVLRKGEKAALLGPNGAGKSTLLKTVLGELSPLSGKTKIGNRVKIGYFSQSYERLDPKQTLLDNFLTEYGYTTEYTRSLLGGMLFHGDDVFKEIGTLSGGQKARLVLLKLVLDGANLLILDEPTNHLDIAAREAVEAALEAYDGTVLVVSHDRYFINEVASRIWEIDNQQINDFKGNYSFYVEEKAKRSVLIPTASAEGSSEKEVIVSERKQTKIKTEEKPRRYSEQEREKLLAKVELCIREQEAMLKVLERQLADPANHEDMENSEKLALEYEQTKQEIDSLMLKWEELMTAS
ncbi:MAG: ATP-binding cassette domain-containing protein [Acidaminococcaceae bacterium]